MAVLATELSTVRAAESVRENRANQIFWTECTMKFLLGTFLLHNFQGERSSGTKEPIGLY